MHILITLCSNKNSELL